MFFWEDVKFNQEVSNNANGIKFLLASMFELNIF